MKRRVRLVIRTFLSGLLVLLPLVAMVSRVEWGSFFELITSEASQDALVLSLKTSTAATITCT